MESNYTPTLLEPEKRQNHLCAASMMVQANAQHYLHFPSIAAGDYFRLLIHLMRGRFDTNHAQHPQPLFDCTTPEGGF
jgi:hypothetical protein